LEERSDQSLSAQTSAVVIAQQPFERKGEGREAKKIKESKW
jgi:hypothetical protein